MQEIRVQSLGRKDLLDKEMATDFSILAGRIPWTEEPGRLPSIGLQASDMTQQLNNNRLHWAVFLGMCQPAILHSFRMNAPCSLNHEWTALAPFVFVTWSPSPTVQFRSVAQSCPTLCNPMDCSTPGLPVRHQLLEFTQTHVH